MEVFRLKNDSKNKINQLIKKDDDSEKLNDELNDDENIYEDKGVDELLEEDEISDSEAGFMEGIIHGKKTSKCSYCKKTILKENCNYKYKLNDKIYYFDSLECKKKWLKNHELEND